MVMKLTKIERGNPSNPGQKKKWYLTKSAGRPIELDEIAEDIQGRSAMTKGDILSVLSNLVQVLPAHLKKGDSVRLGSFGSFRLSVASNGVEDAADLTAKQVKGTRVVFVAGTELKRELNGITYSVGQDA
ncbi:MAG: HU family DNA-binding protein [Azoarcus sp.]|nr:HU family DNA-binding protein [Azoarcus sp.]